VIRTTNVSQTERKAATTMAQPIGRPSTMVVVALSTVSQPPRIISQLMRPAMTV
jgi:hypothetical protein